MSSETERSDGTTPSDRDRPADATPEDPHTAADSRSGGSEPPDDDATLTDSEDIGTGNIEPGTPGTDATGEAPGDSGDAGSRTTAHGTPSVPTANSDDAVSGTSEPGPTESNETDPTESNETDRTESNETDLTESSPSAHRSAETGESGSDTTESASARADGDDDANGPSGESTAPGDAHDDADTPRFSPALIATAVALPVALIVAVLVMAVMSRQNPVRDPLALGSIPAPGATGPACSALLPALPDALGDYTRAELAQPAPPATLAWQLPDGGEPIVLRCGMDRPMEFNAASPLQVINGVNWFEVRDQASGATSGTWFAVDRGTYIAVTVADSAGPTPLQDISNVITKTVPTQPLDPGPLPN